MAKTDLVQPEFLDALPARLNRVFGTEWSPAAARQLHQEIEQLAEAAEAEGRAAVSEAALELAVYLCSLVEAEQPASELQRARIADMAEQIVHEASPGAASSAERRPPREHPDAALVIQLGDAHARHLDLAAALGRRQLLVRQADDLGELERLLERRSPDVLLIGPAWIDLCAEALRLLERFSHGRVAPPGCIVWATGTDRSRRLYALRAGADRTIETDDAEAVAQAIAEFLQQRRRAAFRVLVVEDDRAQAMFATAVLSHRGIETRVANSAAEALQATAEFWPDLILLDLHLPDRNGIEVAQLLRERPSLDYVQIVFLSGEPSMEEQFRAIRLGGDDWVSKPVKPRHLLAVVDSRAERAHRLRAGGHGMPKPQPYGLLDRERFAEELERARLGSAALPLALLVLAPKTPLTMGGAPGFLEQDALSEEITETLLAHAFLLPGVCRAEPFLFLALADLREPERLTQQLTELAQDLQAHRWLSNEYPFTLAITLAAIRLDEQLASTDAAIVAVCALLQQARTSSSGQLIDFDSTAAATTPAARALRPLLAGEAPLAEARLSFQPLLPVRGTLTGQYLIDISLHAAGLKLNRAEALEQARSIAAAAAFDRWLLSLALGVLHDRASAQKELGLLVPISGDSLDDERLVPWLRTELSRLPLPLGATLALLIDDQDLGGTRVRAQRKLAPLAATGLRIVVGPLGAEAFELGLIELAEINSVLTRPLHENDLKLADKLLKLARDYGKTIIVAGVDARGQLREAFHHPVHYILGAAVAPALPTPEFEFPAE